jgi:hypothetical protein
MSPLSNSFLQADQLHEQEAFYPLHAYVCENCLLVQLEEFETPESIFSAYLYVSSFSDSWLEHARLYAAMIANRPGLNETSQVLGIASNDGYLLQYFLPLNVPVLSIEAAENVEV